MGALILDLHPTRGIGVMPRKMDAWDSIPGLQTTPDDTRKLAPSTGIEPVLADRESAVLPLDELGLESPLGVAPRPAR